MNIRILAAIVLWLAAAAAGAQTVQLKIATLAPENSGWMQGMREGAREIKTRTEGRVALKFYGGGVMGNDRKVLRKMRIGQLQGGSFTASGLGERYPDINLYGFPLMFNSLDEVNHVRGQLDDELMRGLEAVGLVGFGIAEGGFARIMSNVPVRTYEDLKGRKIWVPEGDEITYRAMKALDLSPVVLPITDVLTGLQTGLIEMIGTPPVGAIALQWYTKVHYLTDAPIIYTYAVLVLEKKAFERLRPEDQAVVREVMTATYREFDRQNRVDNREAMAALEANGIGIVEPVPGAIASWRERLGDLNRELVDQGLVSAGLYARMTALLEAYRAGGGYAPAQAPEPDTEPAG